MRQTLNAFLHKLCEHLYSSVFTTEKVVELDITASTDQLCNFLLDDSFNVDVMYFVMLAELLRHSGFPHSWRSKQAYFNWLKNKGGWFYATQGWNEGEMTAFLK